MEEFFIAALILLYIFIVIGCCIISFKNVWKYNKRKKKPNLILIQGGKSFNSTLSDEERLI